MRLKASGGRLRAGGATVAIICLVGLPRVAAGAAGSSPAAPPSPAPAPSPPGNSVPPLPTVSPDITDGQPIQSLYAMALSLSSDSALSAQLRSQIAATQKQLDADAVAATQAAAVEAAADSEAANAESHAEAAARAYSDLDGALKHAVLFMYTSGPTYVRVNPGAGDKLAYASDYASTALTPGGILSTRKYDASIRKSELAVAKSAQQQADQAAQQAAVAVAAERAAEAALETQLAAVVAASSPQLMAETTALAGQAGQELLSTAGLEFTPASPLPPPVSTTPIALAWVFSELGKQYVWGATGPDTFDCSGLTQFVWHQAGVDIPRVAADQDNWTVPVPLSQLLPGDLVFFGKSDIHHVGIYIGSGLMINAPHTGDVVRVSSIWWSDLAGFGRVHDANVPVPVHLAPTPSKPAAPAVVSTAGNVPSQTQPPPGWQPQPGSTTPIVVDGTGNGGSNTNASTTTSTTTPSSSPGSSTTTTPPATSTTTVPTSASNVSSTTTLPGG
ncbi:MAG TPA: C40 family peptidase [Acidimicrobiales bacterium]